MKNIKLQKLGFLLCCIILTSCAKEKLKTNQSDEISNKIAIETDTIMQQESQEPVKEEVQEVIPERIIIKREHFLCPNWHYYLEYPKTFRYNNEVVNKDGIKSLIVYEQHDNAEKRISYIANWEKGNLVFEKYIPLYGDIFSKNYIYDDKNVLVRTYYEYLKDDIPGDTDYSFEYYYDDEIDMMVCKKSNKIGDYFIYREEITPNGFIIYEDFISHHGRLSSYSNTITLEFEDNKLIKRETVYKDETYLYRFYYRENEFELNLFIDGKIDAKEIIQMAGDNPVSQIYSVRNGFAKKIYDFSLLKIDNHGNWTERYLAENNSYDFCEIEYYEEDDNIISENKYIEYDLGYDNIVISQDTAKYENITGLEIGNYVYPKEVVLSLKNEDPYQIGKNNENNKTGLILKNSDLCIVYYDEENRDINTPFFIGINEDSKKMILNGLLIKSSSNLTEKDKIYSPDNLYRLELNLPWVENDSDYGIGEYLEFELAGYHGERLFSASGFYIINGFVSITNQSLYSKNTRIKKLKLVDLDTQEEWEQILEDTPNPQFVDCKGHEGNRIRAIIQDVYPGDLWKDTCVSGIILTK